MDAVKYMYLSALGIFLYQSYHARRAVLNWPIILAAVSLHAFYYFELAGLSFLLFIALVSTLVELVSLKTKFNFFGVTYSYDLTHKLFPSRLVLMGVYPLEVTAAWILLKYTSFFLVITLLLSFPASLIAKSVVTAVVLVSFDLLVDPIAVAWGAWKWKRRGMFFGIPWQNFLGWFAVGLITSFFAPHISPLHPVDLVAFFPITIVVISVVFGMGRKLFSRNPLQGTLAFLPLSAFFLLSVLNLLGRYPVN